MSKKDKKIKEQTAPKPEVTTKEKKARKAIFNRWLFRVIILLLVAFIAFGIYYNLKTAQNVPQVKTNDTQTRFVAPRPTKVIPVNPEVIDIQVEAPLNEPLNPIAAGDITSPTLADNTDKSKVDLMTNIDTSGVAEVSDATDTGMSNEQGIDGNLPIIVAPQEHAEIIVVKPSSVFDESTNKSSNDVSKVNENIKVSFEDEKPASEKTLRYVGYDPTKPHFTPADALNLRDNFLSEEPCGDDLRKLIMSDNQSEAAQAVIKDTSYFCFATTNVQNELKNLFLKSKKEALIRYYKEHDPRWKYRLKKVFVTLVKTRNLNPTGNTVPDLLDRAHNALMAKNMTLTIETLAMLPDNIRAMFTEFMQKTENFVKAKTALDALILSYSKGE